MATLHAIPPFPTPGMRLIKGDEHIAIWEEVFEPGKPTPPHQHTRDYIFLSPHGGEAERAGFQCAIGESDLRLRAARGLVLESLEKAWKTACEGRTPEPSLQVEMSSATTLVTDVALEVTIHAFRYGGGTAVHLNHMLQR